MTQYIDKSTIVAEIEKLKSNLIYGACASQIAMETHCKEEAYNNVLSFLDTLEVKDVQEEPVSNDLEEAARKIATRHSRITGDTYYANDAWFFKKGAQWQKEQFEKNRLEHCDSITEEQYNLECGFIDQHIEKYHRIPTILDAIEYGMKKQREITYESM